MDFFSNAIQNGDGWGYFFFGLILMFVGDRMINAYPTLRVWGIRAFAIAFVVFTASYIIREADFTGSTYALAAVIGVLAGIVTLGPAWIALALVGFLHKHYRTAAASASSAAHRRTLEKEREIAKEKERQAQVEWERRAPEREQAQREAALREAEHSKKLAIAQKTRADARADCELLYQLYSPEISSRFPRASLDEWITKYMGDNQSPADVEQRADQLRKLIIHHREQVKPTPKFSTMPELAAWFQEQKTQIETLPIEDRLRRSLLAHLNIRNTELMTKLLQEE